MTDKMSQEYRDLKERLDRMAGRKERALKAINDLESVRADLGTIVAEVDTDMMMLKLQLEALAAAGDTEDQ